MPTNRRPFSRDRQPPFPPEAIEAFRKMVALEDQFETWPPADPHFDAWADQHWLLHQALHLKPWNWWAVEPPNVEGPENSRGARARWCALAQAAGIEIEA
jgi:hypothetical protein